MGTESIPVPTKQDRKKRIIQAVLSIAVIVAVFFFALPQIADFSKVWEVMSAMTWLELTTLLLLAVWNIVTYWLVTAASLPGSNVWQAMKVAQTSTAVANTIPGGGAIGVGVSYSMWTDYGFSRPEISLSVLVTGIWNNFVKLGMPVVALTFLVIQGRATGALVLASLIGLGVLVGSIVLFGLILKSEPVAERVGARLASVVGGIQRLLRKKESTGTARGVVDFRRDAIHLLRKRGWWLSITMLVSHLTLWAVLLLTLRNVGVSEQEVGWAEVLAAFAFVRLISALPITPGGLGVVELGMTAALVAAGGGRPNVVAAVLVYRGLTYLLPVPFGILTYAEFRRGAKTRRERLEEQQAVGASPNT